MKVDGVATNKNTLGSLQGEPAPIAGKEVQRNGLKHISPDASWPPAERQNAWKPLQSGKNACAAESERGPVSGGAAGSEQGKAGGGAGAKAADELPGWLVKGSERIPCLGIIFSLFASMFLCTAGMLVKMTRSVHGVQVAVLRKPVPAAGEWLACLGRALLGSVSITCSYFAFKLIPLGDATVIKFSMPIWTMIIGYLVLRESCSLLKVSAVLISILGVTLIAKPDDCLELLGKARDLLQWQAPDGGVARVPLPAADGYVSLEELVEQVAEELPEMSGMLPQLDGATDPARGLEMRLTGCLLALSSSICLAASFVAMRLCPKTSAEVSVFYLSLVSIVVGTVVLLALGEWRLPDNLMDLLMVLANGGCGAIGQWFIVNALRIEQSGVISLVRTFDIQVAFMYSAFLLDEEIRVTSLVGSLLVSYSVLSVIVPKWLAGRKRATKLDGSDAEAAPEERRPAH